MEEKIWDNIEQLIDRRKIDAIIKESLKEIGLCKKSVWQYAIAITLGAIIACFVSFSFGTVSTMIEIAELLFETSIGIVGIVLGAYSIFQALMKKELIWILVKSDENILKQSNKTFLNITILYVANALVSLTIRIILRAIGREFVIFSKVLLNNIFSAIFIFIYIVFNLLLLLEMVVFSINLYRMFCVYNTISAIEAAKAEEKLEDDND